MTEAWRNHYDTWKLASPPEPEYDDDGEPIDPDEQEAQREAAARGTRRTATRRRTIQPRQSGGLVTMTAIAKFTPQAWINDYAITVDPEGPTEWETSFDGLTDVQISRIVDLGHDLDDLLKDDPAAPDWVREWSGPFEIHVREEQ